LSAPCAWVLERDAEAYPSCLTDLDPPERPRLYGVGRRAVVERFDYRSAVTIVGARRASSYGLQVAERLARDLAAAGVTIVSGMARGIDAAAHRGALTADGLTIAVLANGPDVVYPPVNRPIYERILERGAVVAEHPPGTRARRYDFPARNRIMAALAGLVVIVEAAQPSGSLITADLAAKLGRTVGAVPGQVGIPVAAGTNDLIKEGAELIRDARDALDLLYGVGADRRAVVRVNLDPPPGPSLEPSLRAVLELVEAGASTVDRIAAEASLPPCETAVALGRLELLGYVVGEAHGGFRRSAMPAPA
jgi:DNA processing protein